MKVTKRLIYLALTLASVTLPTSIACACTSIRIKTTDGLVFYARTMEGELDFHSTVAIVPKGTEFQGTLPNGDQKGLAWKTRYGFVGMSTFGLPLLSDGMNEAGLAVGNLMFPDFAGYQSFDPKQADHTLAQYEVVTWILGNFATVDEVREAIKGVRVCEGPEQQAIKLELHFVVHDATGKCLVIEYVNGELHVYDNPIGVMTNSPTFDWHLINLRNHINISATNVKPLEIDGLKETGLGQGSGMLGLPGDYTPPSRFVRMVALVTSAVPATGPEAGLNQAMTIIDNADIVRGAIRDTRNGKTGYDITYWSVVSDLARKRYYFRTYDNKEWRYVDVAKALADAKSIKSVKIDTTPNYREVSAAAEEFKFPMTSFPAGKP
jgi:choloylglycine hydrolase